jgi:hypothetical protein
VFNNANKWQARELDLLRGLALSVECDKRAQAAREKLERLLGPATAVIASGGEWVDQETGEVLPKLHLHWRLQKPVEDQCARPGNWERGEREFARQRQDPARPSAIDLAESSS